MSTRTIYLPDAMHQYLLDTGVQETDIMRRLRERTASLEKAEMQISPEQGQFMRLLVRLVGARRAIEIGVFTGYSALCVASALPPDGKLIACDVSEEWTAIARPYWREAGLAERIDLRLAPALQTLDALLADGQAGRFDFAFIDADKVNSPNYYERVLTLLRVGGVLAMDNAFRGGNVADPTAADADTRATRAVNAQAFKDPRVMASLVPIGDGLLLAVKVRD